MAAKKDRKKSYSDAEAAKLLAKWKGLRESGLTAGDAAKKVGVHQSLLYFWRSKENGGWARTKKSDSPIASKRTAPEPAEQDTRRAASKVERELRGEIARLKAEIEILKQAVGVFSRSAG